MIPFKPESRDAAHLALYQALRDGDSYSIPEIDRAIQLAINYLCPETTRTVTLRFRVTPDEERAIRQLAQTEELTLSQYLRDKALQL